MPDHTRKEYEDDEIVKLQRAAKGRKAKGAEILPVKWPRIIACVKIVDAIDSLSSDQVADMMPSLRGRVLMRQLRLHCKA